MNKLRIIVDDERTFAAISGADDVYARNTQEAWLAILDAERTGGMDELWLDHDLGPDEDILILLDFLCERAYEGNPVKAGRIYVHSQNPAGAATVVRSLERYGYNVYRTMLPPLV